MQVCVGLIFLVISRVSIRNRLTDIENRLVVAKGAGGIEGLEV